MGTYLTVWVVDDFVAVGGWVHTLLSGWYVVLCGVGTYLTVWVVGDFVLCGGWGWVHTLLSGW